MGVKPFSEMFNGPLGDGEPGGGAMTATICNDILLGGVMNNMGQMKRMNGGASRSFGGRAGVCYDPCGFMEVFGYTGSDEPENAWGPLGVG